MRKVIEYPNGVRLALDPSASAATCAAGVWIGGGARDEPLERGGLAHFLEHMAFKGARGLTARQIAEAVESRGAAINAATEYERTSYFVRALPDDAPDMLDMALSLVFAPDHPAGEMAREKAVVRQEMIEAREQPDDLVFELAQSASFGDHPLGQPILGRPATLRRINRNDLLEFSARVYQPRIIVASVAGGYDEPAVRASVERWLAERPAREPPARSPALPQGRFASSPRGADQAHIVLSRPGPASASDQRYIARLAAEILGGGMASRLFQEVREERGLAYTIDASCDQYSDAGRLSVYAACAADRAGEVVELIHSIWAGFADAGPTEEELARSKKVLKAQFAMASESVGARAASGAHELLTFGRLVDLPEVYGLIDRACAGDLRKLAGDMLDAPLSAAVVGPRAAIRACEPLCAA